MNSIEQLARYNYSYEGEAIGAAIAIIVIVIFLAIAAILAQIFLGLAVYHDAKSKGNSSSGMWATFIDETAQLYDEIGVSAGCRGCQVLLDPMQLTDYVNATLCDLTE